MSELARLNIHWVVQGIERDEQAHFTSALASNRYRVLSPASWLNHHGHITKLIAVEQWQFEQVSAPDVLLIGKILPSGSTQQTETLTSHLLNQVRLAREAGVPVLADFNDDHFQHPTLGLYWRTLSSLASVCVAGSAEMANLLRDHTRQPVHVVGDPIGSPFAEPKVFNAGSSTATGGILFKLFGGKKTFQRRLNLAWYGNPVNWPPLQAWTEQLAALGQKQPWCLWALTRISPAMQGYVEQFNARHSPSAVIELQEWNEQDQWDVVRDADVVLVPSDLSDPTKRVKTSNRLTDALHMGRSVVASPLPEYIPYADAAWLTERPLDALTDMLSMPDAAMRKINAGQQLVLQRCSAEAVGKHWLAAIDAAIREPKTAFADKFLSNVPAISQIPVRLNLGCGDKILPGYVNVDVVESRVGKKPDVICDLHQLKPFPDNHADEVMAIHVVEHFWRWEVEAILREWVRVLKPGGKMILECPNLVSACEEFLKDTDTRSREDQAGQRTMWVFYGDPSWKDPYMIHRWGYTPHSLKILLDAVGLVDVKQEPVQFKLRESGDMRIVGVKPVETVPSATAVNNQFCTTPITESLSKSAPFPVPVVQAKPLASDAPDLAELFYHHHGNKTSKWTHYLEVYQRYFAAYRDKACRILEIGVQNGGSLQLYQKYFTQAECIVGIDVDSQCKQVQDGDIVVEIGSQADIGFLNSVCDKYGPFDIVIDDGSHIFSHQRITFETVFPRMANVGVYIAEDLHTSYAPSFGGGVDKVDSFITYCKSLIDQLNAAFFPDPVNRKPWLAEHLFGVSFFDSMVVVERRPKIDPYSVTVGEIGHVQTPEHQDVAYFRRKHYP
jgi:SAM-dependent methyltransferase